MEIQVIGSQSAAHRDLVGQRPVLCAANFTSLVTAKNGRLKFENMKFENINADAESQMMNKLLNEDKQECMYQYVGLLI